MLTVLLHAVVAKLAAAPDLGSGGGHTSVRVRIPSTAPHP